MNLPPSGHQPLPGMASLSSNPVLGFIPGGLIGSVRCRMPVSWLTRWREAARWLRPRPRTLSAGQ